MLRAHYGLLETEAYAKTEQRLISDPLRLRRVYVESRDETSTDRGQKRAEQHRRIVIARNVCDDARNDGHDQESQYQRHDHDTRRKRRGVFDGLEVDGQVGNRDEHGSRAAEGEDGREPDVSVLDNGGGYRARLG